MKKIYFLILFSLTACGKPLPNLEGIDLKEWKEDKKGCKHIREKTLDQLISQKEKLKGLSEDNIIELLGRPDQNELWKRNQKFFHYFIECDSAKTAKKLSIRFNAMERAKDVVIE